MSNVKWIHAPLVSQRMGSWAQLGAPAINLQLETILSRLPLHWGAGKILLFKFILYRMGIPNVLLQQNL